MNYQFIQNNIWIFVVLGIWELGLKAFALWASARNGQKWWFGSILILNTVGILPIIYMTFVSNNKKGGR